MDLVPRVFVVFKAMLAEVLHVESATIPCSRKVDTTEARRLACILTRRTCQIRDYGRNNRCLRNYLRGFSNEATASFMAFVGTRTARFLNHTFLNGVFEEHSECLEMVALQLLGRSNAERQMARALLDAYGELLRAKLSRYLSDNISNILIFNLY